MIVQVSRIDRLVSWSILPQPPLFSHASILSPPAASTSSPPRGGCHFTIRVLTSDDVPGHDHDRGVPGGGGGGSSAPRGWNRPYGQAVRGRWRRAARRGGRRRTEDPTLGVVMVVQRCVERSRGSIRCHGDGRGVSHPPGDDYTPWPAPHLVPRATATAAPRRHNARLVADWSRRRRHHPPAAAPIRQVPTRNDARDLHVPTPTSSPRPADGRHGRPLKIGRSAVRPRPWPPSDQALNSKYGSASHRRSLQLLEWLATIGAYWTPVSRSAPDARQSSERVNTPA